MSKTGNSASNFDTGSEICNGLVRKGVAWLEGEAEGNKSRTSRDSHTSISSGLANRGTFGSNPR
eukprot:3567656-Amphidinium_carterae.1